MKFLRVCHREYRSRDQRIHIGPYCEVNDAVRSGAMSLAALDRLQDETDTHRDLDHPVPDEEGLPEDGIACGFVSRDQLEAWFEGCWDALAECGYVIREYIVPDDSVWIGERQAVCDRTALRVAERDGCVTVVWDELRGEV